MRRKNRYIYILIILIITADHDIRLAYVHTENKIYINIKYFPEENYGQYH